MRALPTLLKREIASYVVSPTAYIITALFLVVMGLGFWSIASYRLIEGASVYDILRGLYGGVAWFAVLMVVPVLTMRCFAEERRSGTLETLMTAPVTAWEVVLAKFLGVLVIYSLMWLPTAAYIVIINRLNDASHTVDLGALRGAYLGGFLVGMFFLSIGVLCSALTRNVIVAAISSFAALAVIFVIGFLPEMSPLPVVQELTAPFSCVLHMLDFARGVVDTRPVALYLSSTVVVLFLTVRAVEAGKWKV